MVELKEAVELRLFCQATINDLTDVFLQVQNSLDFAELTKKLQQERVSVALNFFIKGRESETNNLTELSYFLVIFVDIDTLSDFDNFIEQNVDAKWLKSFTTQHTFNETDQVLQNVGYWPKISDVEYFKSKLKFQIRHSLFRCEIVIIYLAIRPGLCRTKIQEGDKAIEEVLSWYEEVNSQTLAYVTYSIHDSDISDFYREVATNHNPQPRLMSCPANIVHIVT